MPGSPSIASSRSCGVSSSLAAQAVVDGLVGLVTDEREIEAAGAEQPSRRVEPGLDRPPLPARDRGPVAPRRARRAPAGRVPRGAVPPGSPRRSSLHGLYRARVSYLSYVSDMLRGWIFDGCPEVPHRRSARGREEMIERHYKTREVAKLLGVHPETIRRAAQRGELESIRIGLDRIYAESAIQRFLAANLDPAVAALNGAASDSRLQQRKGGSLMAIRKRGKGRWQVRVRPFPEVTRADEGGSGDARARPEAPSQARTPLPGEADHTRRRARRPAPAQDRRWAAGADRSGPPVSATTRTASAPGNRSATRPSRRFGAGRSKTTSLPARPSRRRPRATSCSSSRPPSAPRSRAANRSTSASSRSTRSASRPARGVALEYSELLGLASWLPERIKRIVPFCGTVGLRFTEAVTLTDDRVDLEAATIFIPARINKSRRPKPIPLARIEVQLLREQLLARPTGTRLVFPNETGGTYSKSGFRVDLATGAISRRGSRMRRRTGGTDDHRRRLPLPLAPPHRDLAHGSRRHEGRADR